MSRFENSVVDLSIVSRNLTVKVIWKLDKDLCTLLHPNYENYCEQGRDDQGEFCIGWDRSSKEVRVGKIKQVPGLVCVTAWPDFWDDNSKPWEEQACDLLLSDPDYFKAYEKYGLCVSETYDLANPDFDARFSDWEDDGIAEAIRDRYQILTARDICGAVINYLQETYSDVAIERTGNSFLMGHTSDHGNSNWQFTTIKFTGHLIYPNGRVDQEINLKSPNGLQELCDLYEENS